MHVLFDEGRVETLSSDLLGFFAHESEDRHVKGSFELHPATLDGACFEPWTPLVKQSQSVLPLKEAKIAHLAHPICKLDKAYISDSPAVLTPEVSAVHTSDQHVQRPFDTSAPLRFFSVSLV